MVREVAIEQRCIATNVPVAIAGLQLYVRDANFLFQRFFRVFFG
jgi:hypothetical protein